MGSAAMLVARVARGACSVRHGLTRLDPQARFSWSGGRNEGFGPTARRCSAVCGSMCAGLCPPPPHVAAHRGPGPDWVKPEPTPVPHTHLTAPNRTEPGRGFCSERKEIKREKHGDINECFNGGWRGAAGPQCVYNPFSRERGGANAATGIVGNVVFVFEQYHVVHIERQHRSRVQMKEKRGARAFPEIFSKLSLSGPTEIIFYVSVLILVLRPGVISHAVRFTAHLSDIPDLSVCF